MLMLFPFTVAANILLYASLNLRQSIIIREIYASFFL